MSSQDSHRKMQQACILASKFFRELADIFGEEAGPGGEKRLKLTENGASKAVSASTSKAEAAAKDADGKKDKDKKKSKKGKDGSQIKRPLSAYMLYNNFRRPTLQQEYPEHALTALSKIIGDEWKKLTEDQKKVWLDKAQNLKLDYDIEVHKQKIAAKQDESLNNTASASKSKSPSKSKKDDPARVGEKRTFNEMNGGSRNQSQKTTNQGKALDIDDKEDAGFSMRKMEDKEDLRRKRSEIHDSNSITSLSDDMEQNGNDDDVASESSDL